MLLRLFLFSFVVEDAQRSILKLLSLVAVVMMTGKI